MNKYYKLDKTFGPVGTIAGVTLFISGIITSFYSLGGIILIVLGAFVGFTCSGTYIDFENRRVKNITKLFGIIGVGKWINIDENSTIEIQKSNIVWRTYSRSNRTIDISDKYYYVMLYKSRKDSVPLIRTTSLSRANSEAQALIQKLGIIKK